MSMTDLQGDANRYTRQLVALNYLQVNSLVRTKYSTVHSHFKIWYKCCVYNICIVQIA